MRERERERERERKREKWVVESSGWARKDGFSLEWMLLYSVNAFCCCCCCCWRHLRHCVISKYFLPFIDFRILFTLFERLNKFFNRMRGKRKRKERGKEEKGNWWATNNRKFSWDYLYMYLCFDLLLSFRLSFSSFFIIYFFVFFFFQSHHFETTLSSSFDLFSFCLFYLWNYCLVMNRRKQWENFDESQDDNSKDVKKIRACRYGHNATYLN